MIAFIPPPHLKLKSYLCLISSYEHVRLKWKMELRFQNRNNLSVSVSHAGHDLPKKTLTRIHNMVILKTFQWEGELLFEIFLGFFLVKV